MMTKASRCPQHLWRKVHQSSTTWPCSQAWGKAGTLGPQTQVPRHIHTKRPTGGIHTRSCGKKGDSSVVWQLAVVGWPTAGPIRRFCARVKNTRGFSKGTDLLLLLEFVHLEGFRECRSQVHRNPLLDLGGEGCVVKINGAALGIAHGAMVGLHPLAALAQQMLTGRQHGLHGDGAAAVTAHGLVLHLKEL